MRKLTVCFVRTVATIVSVLGIDHAAAAVQCT